MAERKVTGLGPQIGVASTAASTFRPGDMVYNNSETWALADADASTTKADAICLSNRPSDGGIVGDVINVCWEAIIEDTDAPFTAGATYYLSTTAGAFTTTRPESAPDVAQVVGVARSTSILHLKISPPWEISDYQPFQAAVPVENPAGVLDGGNFYSVDYNATNDIGVLTFRIPQNAIAIASAYLWSANETQAGANTVAITVGSAISGTQHDAVTQDATQTSVDLTAGTVDDILRTDISTSFDGTDIFKPGALLGVKMLVTSASSEENHLYGVELIFRCV